MIARPLFLAAAICAAGPTWALDLSLPGEAEETIRRSESNATMHLAIGPWSDGRVKSLTVQGPFVQSAWALSGLDPDTTRLTDGLRTQFEAQGFEVLFSCQTAECGGFDFRYNAGILPAPEMYVDLGDFRYLVARKGKGEAAEHLALVVSRSASSGHVQLTRIGAAIANQPVVLTDPDNQTQMAVPTPVPTDAPIAGPDQSVMERLDQGIPVVLEDLIFAPGSAQLQDRDFASIREITEWLTSQPKARLVLVGHTDDIGSLEANVKISRLRAEAVRQKLLFQNGVKPDQVSAEGVGYLAPRQSNQTEAGRQNNRRVEAVPLASTP